VAIGVNHAFTIRGVVCVVFCLGYRIIVQGYIFYKEVKTMTFEVLWIGFMAFLFLGLVVVCIVHDIAKRRGGKNNGS